MKVGILTHPQEINYGGILQCYALCCFLRKMGHEPIAIQRLPNTNFSIMDGIRRFLRICHCPRYYNRSAIEKSKNIASFISKNIIRTKPIRSQKNMWIVCKKYGLEAVIVGSDQVWRYDYCMQFQFDYFLDFVPKHIIKASYAASLGTNDWFFTNEQSYYISSLLKDFKGISVRESEGKELLKKNLKIDAMQHIDPTMLLSSDDYSIITSSRIVSEKYAFIYWLGDSSEIKDEILNFEQQGMTAISVCLRSKSVLPSVEDWLSYIRYAEVVLTDSFHGCVFSMIFGKRLKVRLNKSGGVGRIQSLFQMFDVPITDNLIVENYNRIIECQIKNSCDYLHSVLS